MYEMQIIAHNVIMLTIFRYKEALVVVFATLDHSAAMETIAESEICMQINVLKLKLATQCKDVQL